MFVDRLIGADLRNNSAWNQRYFVLDHTGFTADVIQYELTYVMNRIRLVKNNESTWNYLRGLLQHGTGKLDQYPDVSMMTIEISYVKGLSNQNSKKARLHSDILIHNSSARCSIQTKRKRVCATNMTFVLRCVIEKGDINNNTG